MSITRRGFMQGAGGALSALSLPPLLTGCGNNPEASAPASTSPVTKTIRDLHFALSTDGFLHPDEDYRLHAGGIQYPLLAHDAASRAAAGPGAEKASHYAKAVALPDHKPLHVYVTQRSDRQGDIRRRHGPTADHGYAMSMIHIPPAARAAALARKAASGTPARVVTKADAPAAAGTGLVDADNLEVAGPLDIAATILFHHANLLTLDPVQAAIVMDHLSEVPGLTDMASLIRAKGRHGWYSLQPILGDDDQPATRSDNGQPFYRYEIDPEVMAAGELALANILNAVHNDPSLKDQLYAAPVVPREPADPAAGAGSVAITKDTVSAGGLTYRLAHDGRQTGLSTTLEGVEGKVVTLSFTSSFLRHLAVFVEFLDADGKVVAPVGFQVNKAPPEFANLAARQETDKLKFLTLLVPPSIYLGAPLLQSRAIVSFIFPANASQARVMAGGLGNGGRRYRDVEEIGVALTSTFEIGLPAVLLASAAALHDDGTNLSDIFTATILSDVIRLYFGMIWSKGDTSAASLMSKSAVFMANIMMKQAMQRVLTFILREEAETTALDGIPFVGWALNAVAIATTAAQLAQTSAEVATSPWLIENRLTVTHDIVVGIDHDPKDYQFPATATHYTVTLTFSHAKTLSRTVALPGTTVSSTRYEAFSGVPAGGVLSVDVVFHSATGWIAGQRTITGIANQNDNGKTQLTIPVVIEERLVPLSSSTQYSHKQKLVSAGGSFAWRAAPAPAQLRGSLNSQAKAGSLSRLLRGSVNQTLGRFSYAWQSFSGSVGQCSNGATNQLGYAYRTVSLTEDPNQGLKFSGCYEAAPTLVANSLWSTPEGVGNHLLVQPVAGTDTFAVRRFRLDMNNRYAGSQVLGTFPFQPDIVRSLPGDVLIGISLAYQKFMTLTLRSEDPDAGDPPEATLSSGPALSFSAIDSNASLLLAPVAMDVTPDDHLLVLEVNPQNPGGAGVLRAFTAGLQPTQLYEGGPHWLLLPSTSGTDRITYLDMAVEKLGYVYILSYLNEGLLASDYRLDILDPQGRYLSTTTGVTAASFDLDAWRNVYTLNYEAISAPGGDTEPSVSEWIPSTPNAARSATGAAA